MAQAISIWKHLMADIFTNAMKPFYSCTTFMILDRIAADNYHTFIKKLFTESGRTISDDADYSVYDVFMSRWLEREF